MLKLPESLHRKIQEPEATPRRAETPGATRVVAMVGQDLTAEVPPIPGAGHTAAHLLCQQGLGGPPPQLGALLVLLAEHFPPLPTAGCQVTQPASKMPWDS